MPKPTLERRSPESAASPSGARGALVAALLLAAASPAARADQPRDYIVDFQPPGTFAILDYFGTGARMTLEHRAPIYGKANDLTAAGELLLGFPLGEVASRLDLRILFLSLGTTVGYRAVWRHLSFEPGADGAYCADCDRGPRRDRDEVFGSSPGSDRWPWVEARSALLFPFNEHVVMASLGAIRHEGRRARSYDWFFTSVHDGGLVARWETQLLLKHRDWGGIGPYVQLMSLPRAGAHVEQWAGGFNAMTRLGLVPRNDLLFVTFLMRPGDPSYGNHAYFAPIRALVVYRLILSL